MQNKKSIINVKSGNENCPSDELMNHFRKRVKKNIKYPKNIEFSKPSIDFFRKHADIIEESETYIKFKWNEIPQEELPPLIVKIRKDKTKYYLQYLKELGEEKTIIKGKQRKGKNKYGKIKINKMDKGEER